VTDADLLPFHTLTHRERRAYDRGRLDSFKFALEHPEQVQAFHDGLLEVLIRIEKELPLPPRDQWIDQDRRDGA
jgi:hypothetical protein